MDRILTRAARSSVVPALLLALALPATAQQNSLGNRAAVGDALRPLAAGSALRAEEAPEGRFESAADSLEWARARKAAHGATGRRLVISLQDRVLTWMNGADTLHAAPIAVGKGTQLEHEGRAWDFSTPRGERRVIGKQRNPVWTPPDWHYVELARDSALTLVRLQRGQGVRLADGNRVVVRGDRIGRVLANGTFEVVPADEEVVFGETLFVPPLGTANRRVEGELGPYKLDLGDRYMIHGTPHKTSIGDAATHGCIRMRDGDLEYLYHRVPVGTRVFIY